MKRVAIIPARGGSKRIPLKNIKPFLGTPIIVYSIRAALECGLFSDVIVSTDDRSIAEVAKAAGASVPFYRSAVNSGDYATTADAVFEVLERLGQLDEAFDTVACLYPTAPFITGAKIRNAVSRFDALGCAGMCTAVKYSFPPERGFIVENDRARAWFPDKIGLRSQDLHDIYHDAGQLYLARYKDFMKTRLLFPEDMALFIVSELESQDIDNETDWILAELKYKFMIDHKQN